MPSPSPGGRLTDGRFKVGEIWGIPIALHASWFLVFGLITWSLAAAYFPSEHPGWTRATYWLVGVLTSAAFFLSILVHELGHSWVALRNGIPIRGITLFVFGGVAQIGREPASPAAEFRIALAGPLTSLALAGLFGSIALITPGTVAVAAAATWLARINLMVALFNLLPGFPLDGGRLFRAVIWRWTGSFQRATRGASVAGRLVALALVGFGVVTVLRGDVVGGMWIVFIGWFLDNAAAATAAQANLRQLLRDVTVSQVMTRECPRVARDRTLEQLVQEEVLGAGRRCFFVTDDGRLRGLVTLHHVKAIPPERRGAVRAEDVMTRVEQLAMIGPGESVLAALEKMDDANVAQLPVVTGSDLLGMIAREHILRYLRVRAELGV